MTDITQSDVDEVLAFTDSIIHKFGPRLVGDESTIQTGKYLHDKFQVFDSTSLESFTLHPKAFLGWIRILVVMYFLGVIALWIQIPLVATIAMIISVAVLVLEFFFYYEVVDPLYKKKQGLNVIGTIEPEEKVKNQIILSGHHDSAFVFNFYIRQPNLYSLRLFGSMGFLATQFLLALIWTVLNAIQTVSISNTIIRIIQIFITIGIVFVVQMWFFRGKQGTPGAGDNLISSAIAYQIGMKLMEAKKNGQGLKHTRVIIASWDGEEAGLRGARAYSQAHKKELQTLPTKVLNMDCIYNVDKFNFLTKDVNQTVSLDENFANECQHIAQELGYRSTVKPIDFLVGGTDAGEFGRINVPATSLVAMTWSNQGRNPHYHTPMDTVEVIEPLAVKGALEICWQCVKNQDPLSETPSDT